LPAPGVGTCEPVGDVPPLQHSAHGANRSLDLHEHEMTYFPGDESVVFFASLNDVNHLPLWVLDLSVMNPDGQCAIGSTQIQPGNLSSPWGLRFQRLKQRAGDVLQWFDSLAGVPDPRREEMLQALLRFPLNTHFQVAVEPPDRKGGEGWRLVIGIRRVARLRERHATELLSHYGVYLARQGHPHDLTRFT
jgi:hypothetical protein